MLILKFIDALQFKCRGIDNEVLRYDGEEVELEYEDEVYSDNEISIGKR